jgi:hypothetical protein
MPDDDALIRALASTPNSPARGFYAGSKPWFQVREYMREQYARRCIAHYRATRAWLKAHPELAEDDDG